MFIRRAKDLIKPLLDDFNKQTGITVNLVTGKEEALLQRLQSEGANTPADVLLTSDAGRFGRRSSGGRAASGTIRGAGEAHPGRLPRS